MCEPTRAAVIARRLVLLLACAVLTCSLAAAPAAAEGVARMTAVEQEHLAELTEWAYRNGATVEAPDCGEVCSELWLSEHRPMPNQATSDELWVS
jgi:outer membrane biogenesis lipoprotein LolB